METVMVCVLGYVEEGDYVAHALEMDIIGVGDSWEEALEELKGNLEAQVSVAQDLGDDSVLFRPAPAHLFKRFKQAQEAQLRSLVRQPAKRPAHRHRATAIAVPWQFDQAVLATA